MLIKIKDFKAMNIFKKLQNAGGNSQAAHNISIMYNKWRWSSKRYSSIYKWLEKQQVIKNPYAMSQLVIII